MKRRQYCRHAFWWSFTSLRLLCLLAQGKLCRCPVTFISAGKESERTRRTLLLPTGRQKLQRLGAKKTLPQEWLTRIKSPAVESPRLHCNTMTQSKHWSLRFVFNYIQTPCKTEAVYMCVSVCEPTHMCTVCVPCVYRVCTGCVPCVWVCVCVVPVYLGRK